MPDDQSNSAPNTDNDRRYFDIVPTRRVTPPPTSRPIIVSAQPLRPDPMMNNPESTPPVSNEGRTVMPQESAPSMPSSEEPAAEAVTSSDSMATSEPSEPDTLAADLPIPAEPVEGLLPEQTDSDEETQPPQMPSEIASEMPASEETVPEVPAELQPTMVDSAVPTESADLAPQAEAYAPPPPPPAPDLPQQAMVTEDNDSLPMDDMNDQLKTIQPDLPDERPAAFVPKGSHRKLHIIIISTLIFIALVILVDVLLDTRIVKTTMNIPHTHLFSQSN